MGGDVSFNNAALVSMTVDNLMPAINSGALTGVYAACPEDSTGNLLGVGPAEEYMGLCESEDGDVLGNCKDMTSSGSGLPSVCNNVPASGIICDSECGDWWYQCAHGVPMLKPVPTGTKCKDSNFVVKSVCADLSAASTPVVTTQEPAEESSTSASASVSASAPSTTLAPIPAPTTSSIPSASSVTTTPKPTPAPTPAPSTTLA